MLILSAVILRLKSTQFDSYKSLLTVLCVNMSKISFQCLILSIEEMLILSAVILRLKSTQFDSYKSLLTVLCVNMSKISVSRTPSLYVGLRIDCVYPIRTTSGE